MSDVLQIVGWGIAGVLVGMVIFQLIARQNRKRWHDEQAQAVPKPDIKPVGHKLPRYTKRRRTQAGWEVYDSYEDDWVVWFVGLCVLDSLFNEPVTSADENTSIHYNEESAASTPASVPEPPPSYDYPSYRSSGGGSSSYESGSSSYDSGGGGDCDGGCD